VFDAADGPLVITVGNNAQFARFCTEVIGRPDLAADERFKTNILRSANRAVLLPALHAELAKRPRAELLEKLTASGIPCGEVLGLLEALQSKRATDAGLVTTQPHPVAGTVNVLAPPYRFDGERLPVRSAPPTLGEGTHDVLQSLLGLSDEKLAALKAGGVV
jgi:crotonobetainyl-CoA:carnitine CoA-transferase CaiB-like acyl-CoA transferase